MPPIGPYSNTHPKSCNLTCLPQKTQPNHNAHIAQIKQGWRKQDNSRVDLAAKGEQRDTRALSLQTHVDRARLRSSYKDIKALLSDSGNARGTLQGQGGPPSPSLYSMQSVVRSLIMALLWGVTSHCPCQGDSATQ